MNHKSFSPLKLVVHQETADFLKGRSLKDFGCIGGMVIDHTDRYNDIPREYHDLEGIRELAAKYNGVPPLETPGASVLEGTTQRSTRLG